MDAAKELAEMIAEAAARRQRGEPVAEHADDAARLIIALGAGDDGAVERFFEALADGLRRRGARLPPVEELPPGVAPLLAAAGEAFVVDGLGRVDLERTADRLDDTMRRAFGTSPRQQREEALRERIRREVADKVAASMRRHGLTPAADADPADSPVDDD